MLRASIILKNTREDKSLELSEVAKKTKISLKYLKAIENEINDDLPTEPYYSLIIKDYANFLGLNGDDILSLYRRDIVQRQRKAATVPGVQFLTPQFVFKLVSIVFFLLFTGYLFYEYSIYNLPPHLKVDWPETELPVKDLKITGTTDPESTVRINQNLILVNNDGSFQGLVDITKDQNKVSIESKSPSGKTTTVEKTYN